MPLEKELKVSSANHNSTRDAAQLFNERYPVQNRKKNIEYRFGNEVTKVAVLGHVAIDIWVILPFSAKKLSDASGLSHTSIQSTSRILKKYKFYTKSISTELNKDNKSRWEFCDIMSRRINTDQDFLFNICFSEECSFFFNHKLKTTVNPTLIDIVEEHECYHEDKLIFPQNDAPTHYALLVRQF
ncbi:hypothetical protein ABEB36_008903 [Hypothenemus hampei]|uniref:Transposase n=1 Tax=Hypothenemus hampei TaxID=57062 RepID=A0ABD1EQM1_HYPHA